MEYLLLGKIIDKFGLDGTLKVYSTTNNAKKRYKKGAKVFIYNEKDDSRKEFTVNSYRSAGNLDYVKLDNLDVNEAELYKGCELQIIKDRGDLEVGYYYYSDLVGCKVENSNHEILGEVSVVEEFPAQITLRVKRNNQKDFFVPFIKQFILKVDIENKIITINVLDGML